MEQTEFSLYLSLPRGFLRKLMTLQNWFITPNFGEIEPSAALFVLSQSAARLSLDCWKHQFFSCQSEISDNSISNGLKVSLTCSHCDWYFPRNIKICCDIIISTTASCPGYFAGKNINYRNKNIFILKIFQITKCEQNLLLSFDFYSLPKLSGGTLFAHLRMLIKQSL